jgi:Tfp pilus assembly protein PilO
MNSAGLMQFLAWLRRYPFCVSCAIVAIAMAVSSWFLWQSVQALDEERDARAKDGEDMLTTRASGKALRKDLADVRDYTRKIEENLAVVDNIVDNKGYFYKIEKQVRANLNDVQQLASPQPDSDSLYRRIPFSLKLSGSFEQLALFLRAIETGPRLANITSFSFRRSAAANAPDLPPSSSLTLDLTVEVLGKP